MGLKDAADDILPDNRQLDSGKENQEDEKDYVIIGNEPHKKKFEKEQWERIKETLSSEMGYASKEVLEMRSSKRYEVLHEAALITHGEMELEESDTAMQTKCDYCGTRLHDDAIAYIAGRPFCPSHPAAKVAKEFSEE